MFELINVKFSKGYMDISILSFGDEYVKSLFLVTYNKQNKLFELKLIYGLFDYLKSWK